MKEEVKILVVDDEEIIRNLLVEHLTDEGYSATAAPSGEDALEAYRNDPDLMVITDIRMGGMTGIELLEKVKEVNEEALVIIITSHAALDSAVGALKAGAYDYIFKPFDDLDQITAVVQRAAEKMMMSRQNRQLVEDLERSNAELALSKEVYKDLANRDGLTGLFNHRYFQDHLKEEVDRSKRYSRSLCLIMLDVDHFKIYNDVNGHPEGDILLRILADILLNRLRGADMVARYGGEEFALLLPETDLQKGRVVAEHIRKSVEETPFKGEKSQPLGKITVSLGLAVLPDDASDDASLVKKADEALYRAKEGGRNLLICASE